MIAVFETCNLVTNSYPHVQLRIYFYSFNHINACVTVCGCMPRVKYTQRLEEGNRSSGTGVTYGSFELSDMGAGNPVLLCKRSTHS